MASFRVLLTSSVLLAILVIILLTTTYLGLAIAIIYMLLTNDNPALWFLIPILIISLLSLISQIRQKKLFVINLSALQTIFLTYITLGQPDNSRIIAIVFLLLLALLSLIKKPRIPPPKNTTREQRTGDVIDIKPKSQE